MLAFVLSGNAICVLLLLFDPSLTLLLHVCVSDAVHSSRGIAVVLACGVVETRWQQQRLTRLICSLWTCCRYGMLAVVLSGNVICVLPE
jgi:hypothetical protein